MSNGVVQFLCRGKQQGCDYGVFGYGSNKALDANSTPANYLSATQDYNVRVTGPCGNSVKRKRDARDFRLKSTRGELKTSLEALILPDLGTNFFTVRALKEKGVELVMRQDPALFTVITSRLRLMFSGCTSLIQSWVRKKSPTILSLMKWGFRVERWVTATREL